MVWESPASRSIPPVDRRRPPLYPAGMTSDPDMHDLARQIVRLDGEIKTSRAENDAMESRIEARLAGMQAHMADWKADMADWKADMARRDKDSQRWVIGLFIAAIVIIPILSNSAAIANLVSLLGN